MCSLSFPSSPQSPKLLSCSAASKPWCYVVGLDTTGNGRVWKKQRSTSQGIQGKEVICQTRGNVFHPISKHRVVGWLKNEAQPRFFKPSSRCLEIGWDTPPSVWYTFLKPLIILGEIQSRSLPNFMTIKITFQTSFTLFSPHELLMSLKKFDTAKFE